MDFSKVLLSRAPRIVITRQALALYRQKRETPKVAYANIRSCISEFPHLSSSEANTLLSSVIQPTRALHQMVCNSPSPVFWEKRLYDYQTMWKRNWRKASYIYHKGGTDVDRQEMSELECEFNRVTRDLLRSLGLLPVPDGEELESDQRGIYWPISLPPITVSNVFNALNDATGLCPLGVHLSALVGQLEKRFCPYDNVQKLTNFPLLPKTLPPQGTAAETLAIYRVLTAYLFYTAFTPKDIHGVLSDSLLSGDGKGHLIGGEIALIKEYFCFLRLYLELCETDDDLREALPHSGHDMILKTNLIGDEAAKEQLFNHQSRRVLLGRLGDWTKYYHSTGGEPLVSSSERDRVRAPAIRKDGLTEEQEKIVRLDLSVGDFLRVKAFAGTGKTRVLAEYAKARPQKRILFLTFNVSVQQDAEKKFGPNVECRTIHALAHRVVLKMQPELAAMMTSDGNLIKEITKTLGLNKETIREALDESLFDDRKKPPSVASVAKVVNETLLSFFSSTEVEIGYGSLHWMMADKLGLRKDVILEWTKRIWDGMKKGKGTRLPHGAYLKMLHLYGASVKGGLKMCKADVLAFGNYDMIMFDEAQDADPVMAEIIFRQRPFLEIIIVGDPYQMIYEFRGTNCECFDDNLYRATYNMSLTHSFRFGLGIAGAANPLLRALGESTSMSAIGEMDILRINIPAMGAPPLTVVEPLPPGLTQSGGSGQYAEIFRRNSTLVDYMFKYCLSHQNHKVCLQTPKHLQPDVLFPLLTAACGLLHGNLAKSGPLKGIKSIWALRNRAKAESPDKRYTQDRYESLSKATDEDPEVDTEKKALLKKVIRQIVIDRELGAPSSISHELKSQILDALKCNLGPKLKELFQAFLSKGLKPQIFSRELALVSQLHSRKLISGPSFLEKIEFCRQRVVGTKDREAADIILTTAHQAKGLEWANVSVDDEFSVPYIHRHDSGTRESVFEEIRTTYVAVTRAQNELHVGEKMAHLLASEWGSYRFFLSPIQGECPSCQGHKRQRNQDTNDGVKPNPVETHGQFIGYEAVLPTGSLGSKLVRNKTNQWPFGDRVDVIGCYLCVEGLYRDNLCSWRQGEGEHNTTLELGRFVSGVKQAVDHGSVTAHITNRLSCGPTRERKGLLEVFKGISIAEEERVLAWRENHMFFSWGVSLKDFKEKLKRNWRKAGTRL